MVMLSIIGLSVLVGLISWAVWDIVSKLSPGKYKPRYRYQKFKDEDGNEITKVVDTEDNDK